MAGAHSTAPAGREAVSTHGWRRALGQSIASILRHDTSLAAAGIAFYIIWAIFPALAVFIVVFERFFGDSRVLRIRSLLRLNLSDAVNALLVAQLDSVARISGAVSTAAILTAVAFAGWSSMRGAHGLITALNQVYGEKEQRTALHRSVVAFVLALSSGVLVCAALAVIAGAYADSPGLGRAGAAVVALTRWPVLIVGMLLLLAVAYGLGPSKREARWQWVTWGAACSSLIWILGSYGFAYFVDRFVPMNPLLGSLGSVMMFLLWTYFTVLVILLGAYINAELEKRARPVSSA